MQVRGWTKPYFVDADHIGMKTVDAFLESSDFFTLDVAEQIGASANAEAIDRVIARHTTLLGRLPIPGIDRRKGDAPKRGHH